MNFWHRSYKSVFGRPTPQEGRVFRVQMLLLFLLSTLLYIGFPGAREWRRVAEEHQMQMVIRGWDGLAWYAWLAAAPVMLWLIRRYPLGRNRFRENLGRMMLGSVVLYLVVAHVRYFLKMMPALGQPGGWATLLDLQTYAYNTFSVLPLDLLTYSGFFAVSFSVDYYFKHRQRSEEAMQLQLRTAQLESELARAELAALRSQLHPHFLFNSFNALVTLVRQQKNEVAVEIIIQLSALLRLAIDRTGLQEIPLHQEIDFIRRYLEIEHVRFGDKLRIDLALEPDTLDVLVPNIVLQPLVENAIKHGISLRTSPGIVRVSAVRKNNFLHIEIADDGPEGPPPECATPKRTGIGLANARAQLDKLYEKNYSLEIAKRAEGGTVVTLDLPWRLAPKP